MGVSLTFLCRSRISLSDFIAGWRLRGDRACLMSRRVRQLAPSALDPCFSLPLERSIRHFYRRAFKHQVLCEPRPYPRLAKPISLMTVHFPSAAERLYWQYPFFRSSVFEQRRMFERRQRPGAHSVHEFAELQRAVTVARN